MEERLGTIVLHFALKRLRLRVHLPLEQQTGGKDEHRVLIERQVTEKARGRADEFGQEAEQTVAQQIEFQLLMAKPGVVAVHVQHNDYEQMEHALVELNWMPTLMVAEVHRPEDGRDISGTAAVEETAQSSDAHRDSQRDRKGITRSLFDSNNGFQKFDRGIGSHDSGHDSLPVGQPPGTMRRR